MAVDTKLVCLAGVLLFAIGSVLPWAHLGADKTWMGFNTPVFPVASVLIVIAVAGVNTDYKFSDMVSLAASGLAFAVILYTFFTAANLTQVPAKAGEIVVDYGLIISMLGSLVVCVAAVMGKGRY